MPPFIRCQKALSTLTVQRIQCLFAVQSENLVFGWKTGGNKENRFLNSKQIMPKCGRYSLVFFRIADLFPY